jgi:hypothetical protein
MRRLYRILRESNPGSSIVYAGRRKDNKDALWQTAHRSFTVAEMKDRQVPRQTGLAILSAVKEAGTALALPAWQMCCEAREKTAIFQIIPNY